MDHQLIERWVANQPRRFVENSLVVVTGDHGQLFGAEGMVEHQTSLHPHGVHVPLFVKTPTKWSGETATVEQPVSLVSLATGLRAVVEGDATNTTTFIHTLTDAQERVVIAADGPTIELSRLRDRYGDVAEKLAVRKIGIVRSDEMSVYSCGWDDDIITKTEYELVDDTRRRRSEERVQQGDIEHGDWLVGGTQRNVDTRTSARLQELGYL
ncbi:MAG TPA: sulfatase-like hydrolase/transferase [Halococcus sp.]|nr:sulfatase-like hydrolase/transferase [Halococcus sp.]